MGYFLRGKNWILVCDLEDFQHLLRKLKFLGPPPLFEATISYHPNIFTLTLPLSDGQASEAWEPSNTKMFFLPLYNKVSSPQKKTDLFML
jgi:hypothetical protein